ncbi:hypothetical protein ABZP36_023445 [Zizania latifolia]
MRSLRLRYCTFRFRDVHASRIDRSCISKSLVTVQEFPHKREVTMVKFSLRILTRHEQMRSIAAHALRSRQRERAEIIIRKGVQKSANSKQNVSWNIGTQCRYPMLPILVGSYYRFQTRAPPHSRLSLAYLS